MEEISDPGGGGDGTEVPQEIHTALHSGPGPFDVAFWRLALVGAGHRKDDTCTLVSPMTNPSFVHRQLEPD